MKPLLPLAAAPARTITGQVPGADKAEALPGVMVVVKGTTNGAEAPLRFGRHTT